MTRAKLKRWSLVLLLLAWYAAAIYLFTAAELDAEDTHPKVEPTELSRQLERDVIRPMGDLVGHLIELQIHLQEGRPTRAGEWPPKDSTVFRWLWGEPDDEFDLTNVRMMRDST